MGFNKVDNSNTEIDLNKMYEIESNQDANAVSPKGARGVGQVMESTWNECAKEMGVDWNYEDDAFNPEKNMQVSEYYLNIVIPRYLKYYNIPRYS